jgi:quinoprotein glucose dehydrogenase
MRRRLPVVSLSLVTLILTVGVSAQQTPASTAAPAAPTMTEWASYGGDLGNARYSPLDLLTRENVANVRVAWRWKSDNFSVPAEYRNESTPIMVKGTLYFTAGVERWVIAADAETGATKWTWHLDEGVRGQKAPRRGAGRGVAYWTDGIRERIFTVTPGMQLVALDAATGQPVPTFGTNGITDIKAQLGVDGIDLVNAAIGNSSPPFVVGNVVVVPPALLEGTRPPSMKNVPGRIVAIDAVTGRLAWRFSTIPAKGEPGSETWENGSAEYTGNAGAWAPLAADATRGLLYVPVEDATGDYYGGHRLGNNLYSSSLVCLDAKTGKRVWHQQLVHHDIWDRDNPTQPILADVTVAGRTIPMVVQLTKQAYAYVFDRTTGAPVWPMPEQPVQASDVPGERAALTQPIPSKPAAFDRQGASTDDLVDFTPALRAEALKVVEKIRLGKNAFTPPSLANAPDGTTGTLVVPGSLGGANWEGGAVDPETGRLYVGSWTSPSVMALAKDPQRSDMDYVGGFGSGTRVSGLPILKPPYSRITAIDLTTGDHAWMVPNGDTPEEIKRNPALAGITIPRTGATARPGLLVTKTLLFAAEGNGARPILHVLDKATGAEIAALTVPGTINGVPMTYAVNGRQFIAFWTSDRATQQPAELVTLALPMPGRGGRGGRGGAPQR